MRLSKSAMKELALPFRACSRASSLSRWPPMCGVLRSTLRFTSMVVCMEPWRGKSTTSFSVGPGGGGGGGGARQVAAVHFPRASSALGCAVRTTRLSISSLCCRERSARRYNHTVR